MVTWSFSPWRMQRIYLSSPQILDMFPNLRFSNLNGMGLGHNLRPGDHRLSQIFGHVYIAVDHPIAFGYSMTLTRNILQKIRLWEIYIAMPPYDPYVWWQQPWFLHIFPYTTHWKAKTRPIETDGSPRRGRRCFTPKCPPSWSLPIDIATSSWGSQEIENWKLWHQVHLWDMCLSWRCWETGWWAPMEIRGSKPFKIQWTTRFEGI
jgi:hypothetical protein